jgi:hypothetical protein
MNTPLHLFLIASLAHPAAAQTISTITPTDAPRSERLVITGAGFGAAQGDSKVLIGGIPAIVTSWSNDRIRCHIAESTPLGPAEVQVLTNQGDDSAAITVLPRDPRSNGRIKWMQRTDHYYSLSRPAIAADGTIYITGVAGPLTALSPDGAVKWAIPGAGGVRPATVGADGNVYTVGPAHTLTALSPEGEFLWGYNAPGNAGPMFVGPGVGPDGKIYAVTEEEPSLGTDYGAFALNPDGSVAWHTSGGYNFRYSPYGWEIVFGDGQLYFATGQGGPIDGNPGIHALDSGSGHENWLRVGIGKVQTDAASNVYWLGAINNNYIGSYDADGSERWTLVYNEFMGQPGGFVVAPDGSSMYCTSTFTHIANLGPDGDIRWSNRQWTHLYNLWGITRDAQRYIATAYPVDNSGPMLRLESTQDQSILWEERVPREHDVWMTPDWEGNFSPDGRTFYLTLHGNNYIDDPYCYVVAIDVTQDGQSCYPDFTGDGALDLFDFLAYVNAFNAGDGPADCTADEKFDLFDFLCFVNAFNAGC